MKKVILCIVMIILFSESVFATHWLLIPGTDNSWCCMQDDGSLAKDKWAMSDTDGDGKYEYYYFNGDGIMLSNTITPDGYQLDVNGAWVVDGIVQTKQIEQSKITSNVIDSTTGNASSSYEKKKELKSNITDKKNVDYVDAIKIGSKNWVNVIRFSGNDSYIKAKSGNFNSLSFEAGIKEKNDDAEYLLTIYVNNKEAEVFDDFSQEGDVITISIDPNSELMIVYSCTVDSGKYLSSNQKSLYIRNARFNKK